MVYKIITIRGFFSILFFFVFNAGHVFAQLNNTALFYNTVVDSGKENEAFVKIQSLSFLKNNEYGGPIIDGYTMFGYQINPQLGYRFSPKFSLEGGIFVNKDFGNNNFTQVLPTLSLKYHQKNFKMIFGNLDGSLNHQLIEPLYNFENVVTNRLEHGIQFMLNEKQFDFDTWLNWLQTTYRETDLKEKISFGLSSNVLKIKNEKWQFKLPFQVLGYHVGGQLDTLNDGASTDFDYNTGIILEYKADFKNLEGVYVDARYVSHTSSYYYNSYSNKQWGDGLLANVGAKFKFDTDVMLSYWNGSNFTSNLGGFLYSSQSLIPIYYYYRERLRELLFLRITKKIELARNINLLLRVEPYYNIRFGLLEYSFGFYISLDQTILLRKKDILR